MSEIFPIVSGLIVGSFLGLIAPRLRLPLGVIAAIVLGTMATIISGEFRIGWEFLFVDIPLVGVSSLAALVGGRALRQRVRSTGSE